MEVVRKLDLNDLGLMVQIRVEIQNYDLRYQKGNNSVLSEKELSERTRTYIEEHLDKNLFMFGIFVGDELFANYDKYV